MKGMKRILVVEDDDIVALELQSQLKGFGYKVLNSVSYGEQVLDKIEELHPDLVLMDIKLKGEMDGIKAAESINLKYDLPIVYLTAYSDKLTVERVKNTDPFGYLIKPYTERELNSIIEIAFFKYEIQKKLKESERRFATTLKCIGDAVISTDVKGNIIFMNSMAEKLSGWNLQEVYQKKITDIIKIINEETRKPVKSFIDRVIKEGIVWDLANHSLLVKKDGSELPIDNSASSIKDDEGNITGMVLVFKNVTVRQQHEKEVLRLNRSIKALGSCNRSLVRVDNEKTLLNDICNILVEIGNYQFVWVGFHTDENTIKIDPVAKAGDDNGYLKVIKEYLNDPADNSDPIPVNRLNDSKNIMQKEKYDINCKVEWRRKAAEKGFVSSICLSLINRQQKIGILEIYSSDVNSFDNEEIILIGEMANDLAFGITTLRARVAKKKAEEELARSEEKYRSLTDNINVGIYRNKPGLDGVFIEVNPAMLKIFGYDSKDEFLKIPVSSFYPNPKDREILDAKLKKNGFINDGIIKLLKKDNTSIFCSITATAVYNDEGYVDYYDGIIENITDRRMAEEALRESEKKYRLLVENTGEGIVVVDENEIIIFSNKAGTDLFGEKTVDLVGKNLREFMSPETYQFITSQTKLRKLGKNSTYEIEIIRQNGEKRQVLVTANPHFDNKGKFSAVYAILRDMTEEKKSEQEKEKIRAQLIQAQKMEAIGILSGGIAHDFNNILTAIQVSMDLAIMQVSRENEIYNDLLEVKKCTSRASRLIRQLLLFSRKHHMEFKIFSLNEVIENLQKMLHRVIGEDIKVCTELQDNAWKLFADQGTIEQILMNLAVNGKDAMPEGGELLISTKNVIIDKESNRRISNTQSGKFVCLSIKDNGVGMSQKTLDHIFDPFFSTKDPGKGTGLGLSVVYGIIKQHNGWVDVSSKLGEGTEFKIYFPIVSEKMQLKFSSKEKNIRHYSGKGKRILFVEDEEKVREFTSNALKINGYKVFEASKASEAKDLFKKQNGNFDIVLSDVVLPDISGLELVNELLLEKPSLSVLLCSGYTDHKARWPLIKQQGFQFLEKPYTLNDLLNKLYAVINNIE